MKSISAFVKGIALLIPPVRDHVEKVSALVQQYEQLNSNCAQLCRDKESLGAQLTSAQQELAFLRDGFKTPIGPFIPPPTEINLAAQERQIVDCFHDIYYTLGQKGHHTNFISWLGYSTLKCPLDLWIYQELICRIRPEIVIETGTASGGSALFLASMCELAGHGAVITIDIDDRPGETRPTNPRLSYLVGSSTDPKLIEELRGMLGSKSCGMVILDSDHRKDHVLEEMRIYHQFIPVGGYLIVEDTNINGHPTYPEFGPGPMEAVQEFLRENDCFEPDTTCERFLLTMNPQGFLRRRK